MSPVTNSIPAAPKTIVVIGSTVAKINGTARDPKRAPRDVDVFYANCQAEGAEKVAKKWAAENGFGDLPLDLHETSLFRKGSCYNPTWKMEVPVPVGMQPDAIVLEGENVFVEGSGYSGFSSIIWGYNEDVEGMIEALMRNAKKNAGYIRIDDKPETERPGTFMEGIKALKNALTHVRPEMWKEACRKSDIADFLNALATKQLKPEIVQRGRDGGRGNATRYGGSELLLWEDTVGTQYGSEPDVPYLEAMSKWFEDDNPET